VTNGDQEDRDDRAEIPRADIDREWEKAEQMLSDARKADEIDISKATIVNRLYYACFHAAQAALYARGWNPQSHGHVQTLLGRELVQRGDLSREFGRFFSDMETYRRRVDYGSGGVERETTDLIERTAEFLATVQPVVEDGSDTS
jgi:uncharacterized protein (UPF0332 family)